MYKQPMFHQWLKICQVAFAFLCVLLAKLDSDITSDLPFILELQIVYLLSYYSPAAAAAE